MKIYLIIPTLKQGGSERVMAELSNQFAKKEFLEVHLILLAKSEDFYFINHNVTIHRLGYQNNGRFGKIFSEFTTFVKLRKLLKSNKPDIILSFMDKYNIFTILSSAFLDLKVFVSDRSNPLKKIPKSTEILKKLTYNFATGIIAQTHFAKSVLECRINHKNIKVIPNPLKSDQNILKKTKEKIILNVGRLVPEKGQKFLLDAFSQLNDQGGWEIVILGEGPLKEDLEGQIKCLGLDNKVSLQGSVKNVDEWYSKASIFAFSSVSEGFPNSLVEAMASGLPCISFDCNAGPSDIIDNGINGLLVNVEDINGYTEKLKELIENEHLRTTLGRNSKSIIERLDSEKIANQYLNFFLENCK
ncbi:glycosyltransferase family 4 protein [Indibacter alkaliphilus]|nr:glycosyltransferase family 4 protein [Indibacter alkaliphilus]